MQGYGLDLSFYEEVKARASEIYARLVDGSMPCDDRCPRARLLLFKLWMDEGFAPSRSRPRAPASQSLSDRRIHGTTASHPPHGLIRATNWFSSRPVLWRVCNQPSWRRLR